MRTRTTRPRAAVLDADEQTVQAFNERIDRQFRAMTRTLTVERKLALLVIAGELDSTGFIGDLLLNAVPVSGQGQASWGTVGLVS